MALAPALAFPAVFLHLKYQPKVSFGVGSTTVGIQLSDVAVLAVVVAAIVVGFRQGWQPLAAARGLWVCEGVFFALVLVATMHPLLWQANYHFLTHLITAAKFCEYGLLAPAVALLMRRPNEALPMLAVAAAWGTLATAWGLLQFAGVVSEFEGKRPLQREPSFLGIHDFAALSGATFALGLVVLALRARSRRDWLLGWLPAIAGGTGIVLSGAAAGGIAAVVAVAVVLAVAAARRVVTLARLTKIIAVAAGVAVGLVLMRSGELARFIRSLGIGSKPKVERNELESYVQRSLLAYIGVRIFLDHPVVGVGWEGSEELENYKPYLDDAHRRFPDQPEAAFPSPEHAWGTQNAYLQSLVDFGLAGFTVLLALLVGAAVFGFRSALRAPPGLLPIAAVGLVWLVVAACAWNGLGLVAGIPLDALTWLGVGLVGSAVSWTSDARPA